MSQHDENQPPAFDADYDSLVFSPVGIKRFSLMSLNNHSAQPDASPPQSRNRFSYSSTFSSPFITTPRIARSFRGPEPVRSNRTLSYNDTYESMADELEMIDSLPPFVPQPKPRPWRQLQLYSREQGGGSMRSQPGAGSTSHTKENEQLRRDITSFKIQIRIFREFIQELIRRTGHEHDERFRSELIDEFAARARDANFAPEEELENGGSTTLGTELRAEEDREWVEALSGWEFIANDILQALALSADENSRTAIERVLAKPLGLKLKVIQLELSKVLQQLDLVAFQPNGTPSVTDDESEHILNALQAVERELALQRQSTESIRCRLLKERESRRGSRGAGEGNVEELPLSTERLREERRQLQEELNDARLVASSVGHAQKMGSERSAAEISQLRAEVALANTLIARLKQQQEQTLAEGEASTLSHDRRAAQEASFIATIKTLTDQLAGQEEEIKRKTDSLHHSHLAHSATERNHKRLIEELQEGLAQAVNKQRSLAAEKVRLSYTIEGLTSEKASLVANIRTLTEKLAGAPELTTLVEQANNFEQHYEEILNKDIAIADKFLTSFERILDDASLGQARGKLSFLKARETDMITATKVRELHHALFAYYAVAVDAVVTDHVLLLLKDSSDKTERAMQPEDTGELKLRIEELYGRWKKEREARVLESTASRERCDALESENALLRQRLKELS